MQPLRGSGARIDSFEREMLTFALYWMPYGGPPDDEVYPRFGVTSRELLRRVFSILADRTTFRNSSAADRTLMTRVAIAVGSTPESGAPPR